MTILRILFIIVLTASLLVVHWIGSRREKVAKGPEHETSTSPESREEVEPTKKPEPEPTPPPLSEPPPQPETSPPLPSEPEPPKKEAPKPDVALIDGYTSEKSARRTQTHFLPCHGGPNNERYTVFPVDPTVALKIGSMTVIVTGFEPYKHAGRDDSASENDPKPATKTKPSDTPTKSEPKVVFSIPRQDRTWIGIEGFSVYAIENVDSVPRLAHVGTVDLLEYGRFGIPPGDPLVTNPCPTTRRSRRREKSAGSRQG